MQRGRDSVHTVVEEEKRGNTISIQTHCFLGGAIPHAKGSMAHDLRLASEEKTNTRIFRCSPWERTRHVWRLFKTTNLTSSLLARDCSLRSF
jgi:hypothetical protein